MKVLKRAEQRSAILNRDWYSSFMIKCLLEKRAIFYFDDNMNACYGYANYCGEELRVWLVDCEEIKVEYRGEYTTVVTLKQNVLIDDIEISKLHVSL